MERFKYEDFWNKCMTDERPIDPRLEGFRQYLDERVAEQEKRPYGE